MRLLRHAVALLLLASVPARAQSCPDGRMALVLSGGGAKGLAHIGVLRVLDSLGIRPDLVVGTSMGAIVGAMYASGYTGRQIDSLARVLPLDALFRRYDPQTPRSLGGRPPLIVWEQGQSSLILQRATVDEPNVNALLNAGLIRGNLLARGNFDSLPIPFRAVATDLLTREAVVLGSGDLARSVRASVAIPLVFGPVRLGNRFIADGGLAANIPISSARAAGAKWVIASDATEHQRDSLDLESPVVLAQHLVDFLFAQRLDSLTDRDVYIRPAVDGFRSLDFSPDKVAELIDRGYAAAALALRAACHPAGRPARGYRLPSRTGATSYQGGPDADRQLLERTLGLRGFDTLDVPLLRTRLRRLGNSERFREVWLAPSGRVDSTAFDIAFRSQPRRVAALGIAYDNDVGGRVWIGVADRHLLGQAGGGSVTVFLGQLRQQLDFELRFPSNHERPFTPFVAARAGRESVRRFDSTGVELAPTRIREGVAWIGAEQQVGTWLIVRLGGVGHLWHQGASGDRSAAGANARLESSAGCRCELHADAVYTKAYHLVSFDAALPFNLAGAQVTPALRFGWGDSLPAQTTFQLGGDDGFPGLHIGERRGNREVLARLGVTHPLLGPLTARFEVVSGRVSQGGAAVPQGKWLFGGRVGLGADTPIGPIRVEYGRTTGRGAMFVRVGRWF